MAQLTPIDQHDFSGGENTVVSPYAVLPKQVQQAINVMLDEHGAMRTRDGTKAVSLAAPRPDRPIVKLFDFVNTAGVVKHLAIQKGTFGNNSLFLWNTNPWTALGDFTTSYATPDMLVMTNMAIIAAGNQETVKYYDPSNATPFGPLTDGSGNQPNANHLAIFLGYLYVGNTFPSTTGLKGTSSLQSSDINNPNSWPAANQTWIAKDDGSSITGLGQYTIAESGISPTSTLIIWKDFSGYEATGVLGTANFSVQKIKSDMGCVAGRTIQFISGFGIVRLTHRGFALYDGVNDTLISEEERPRIFGRNQYTGLDWPNIGMSMATQVPNPPLYICACPIAGGNGALQRVFVYDLVRRSWTVCSFNNDIGTVQLSLVPNALPTTYFGDMSKGFVRRAFAGDTDDDGVPINWSILTRAFTGQTPTSRTMFIRLLAAFFNIAPGTIVTATAIVSPTDNLGNKSVNRTVPTITQANTLAGWGNAQWGSSPWGGTSASVTSDTILDFGIMRRATAIQIQLSSSGPMTLRSVSFQARALPESRAVYAGV